MRRACRSWSAPRRSSSRPRPCMASWWRSRSGIRARSSRPGEVPPGTRILNPVFDATPPEYIDAIVTEIGVVPPSAAYEIIVRQLGQEFIFEANYEMVSALEYSEKYLHLGEKIDLDAHVDLRLQGQDRPADEGGGGGHRHRAIHRHLDRTKHAEGGDLPSLQRKGDRHPGRHLRDRLSRWRTSAWTSEGCLRYSASSLATSSVWMC